jgi:hypothetical protein
MMELDEETSAVSGQRPRRRNERDAPLVRSDLSLIETIQWNQANEQITRDTSRFSRSSHLPTGSIETHLNVASRPVSCRVVLCRAVRRSAHPFAPCRSLDLASIRVVLIDRLA